MEDSQIVAAIPYLNRYALKLTRNKSDADDLVSMTVLKAIEIIRFNNLFVEKPNPYLARVMYNTFVSQFCRPKKSTELGDYQATVEPRQENVVMLSEVMVRVNGLPINDRRIVQAFMDGQTPATISRRMRGYRTGKSTVQKVIRNFREGIAKGATQ